MFTPAEKEPTIDQLLEWLGNAIKLAADLPPSMHSVQTDLADAYERIKAEKQRQEKIDPE